MRTLVVLACLLAVAVANPEWESFKATFNRKYSNPTEEAFRKKIFLNNLMAIDQQNQRYDEGKSTFTMGVNQFADLTTQEFSETMNNYKSKPRDPAHDQHISAQANPTSMDWRTSGCVIEVKDQGQCGSCWAFSAIGSTEFANCNVTKNNVSLSEQNVVDCSWSYGNRGCGGGLMNSAFEYMIDNKGVETEESYPYTAKSPLNNCSYDADYKGGSISDYKNILPLGNESSLETAVATHGPISVAIDASKASFQFYVKGVYDEPLCSSTQLDHGVLCVGYGVDAGVSFWLVKNSWGTGWGIQGYIEMSKDKQNQCGIASEASYPIY